MTVVNNASVIFKDKNGNVGKVKAPSANDITKISTAISDVAQVVDPTSHLPINATTSSAGVVQLADSAAVSAGTAGRIVDAAQLKAAIEGVTPAGNLVTTDTAQSITAKKTFTVLPESSVVPTTDDQLANKKYVDDHVPSISNMVTTDTAQTVSAVKTFSTLPESSVAPTTANQLVNKTYADTKADIEVASTYAEPAADKGILSAATDCITAPGSGSTFEARGVKTGVMEIFTGSQVPAGYILCNGAAVSRTTYARLFAEIGTTYGAGDGTTTFNVPDMRDRYVIGANANVLGTQVAEQLPDVQGVLSPVCLAPTGSITQIGAFANSYALSLQNAIGSASYSATVDFKASNSNLIYTDNGHVYPASIALNFIIKT